MRRSGAVRTDSDRSSARKASKGMITSSKKEKGLRLRKPTKEFESRIRRDWRAVLDEREHLGAAPTTGCQTTEPPARPGARATTPNLPRKPPMWSVSTSIRPPRRLFSIVGAFRDRKLHVILDNLATHKKNERWLKKLPNVLFIFPRRGRRGLAGTYRSISSRLKWAKLHRGAEVPLAHRDKPSALPSCTE